MTESALSAHDEEILSRCFNPSGLPFLKPSLQQPKNEPYTEIDSNQLETIQREEAEAVLLAENQKLKEALNKLTTLIDSSPFYDSAYNNRAQVLQLLQEPQKAIKDLTTAIELSNGKRDLIASKAFTQRGLLLKYMGDDEGARIDLEKGASLGNLVAKKEAVSLNPYAQLCNQMVQQAMAPFLQPNNMDEDGLPANRPAKKTKMEE